MPPSCARVVQLITSPTGCIPYSSSSGAAANTSTWHVSSMPKSTQFLDISSLQVCIPTSTYRQFSSGHTAPIQQLQYVQLFIFFVYLQVGTGRWVVDGKRYRHMHLEPRCLLVCSSTSAVVLWGFYPGTHYTYRNVSFGALCHYEYTSTVIAENCSVLLLNTGPPQQSTINTCTRRRHYPTVLCVQCARPCLRRPTSLQSPTP